MSVLDGHTGRSNRDGYFLVASLRLIEQVLRLLLGTGTCTRYTYQIKIYIYNNIKSFRILKSKI